MGTGMYVIIFLADLIVLRNFRFDGCFNTLTHIHIYMMKL